MGAPPPPSYHEAAAYPHLQPPRRLRKVFTVRTGIALLLAVQLSWLYLWTSRNGSTTSPLSAMQLRKFEAGLASCASIHSFPTRLEPGDRRQNPRWNPTTGQNQTIIVRNATLFDGEDFITDAVDIVFSKGLIVSVSPSGPRVASHEPQERAEEYDLHGAYVTPGLVDMHSHHTAMSWPALDATEDSNEMFGGMGPLTPFLRVLDSLKPYDVATSRIASGGVTTSLIIPGSANIMGGEGTIIKNTVRPGPHGEYVIEEMLLEHGIDASERKRYMKMACGENPKVVYGHTRMGNAWLLREWLARAKELLEKQDTWCEAAQQMSTSTMQHMATFVAEKGGFPEDLKLDSTVGMLRGRVAMHNHCYEPEDMETMLRISHEFGFRVRAFHHALAAWQVPEFLKEHGENITIATFAEFGLYKQEAYAASLYGGKILHDHGVPVAYKSDHSGGDLNAQYLLLQAAVGHSFGLPADKALQAVTSVPARSLEVDDRVGYTRKGYDADLVVWDAHPLSVGATPRQVFIDGVATLDPTKVAENTAHILVVKDEEEEGRGSDMPAMRATISAEARQELCAKVEEPQASSRRAFVITGIKKSFLEEFPSLLPSVVARNMDVTVRDNITLVVADGKVTCLGFSCTHATAQLHETYSDKNSIVTFDLHNGHLTRGLIAVTSALGIAEITTDSSTGDGLASKISPKEDENGSSNNNIDHAKYGVRLAGSQGSSYGKIFSRARLGGVTRAVQAPLKDSEQGRGGGLIVGMSTGMRTARRSTLLNGGLFREDVALHVALGEEAKGDEGTVSMGIQRLRGLVKAGAKGATAAAAAAAAEEEEGSDGLTWKLVANGSLPLVVKADSAHDIQQVILFKRDFPNVHTVILGGQEAPLVAHEIAQAEIPLITTAVHASPDRWDAKDSLPGPPLSRSTSDILSEAGVFYGVAINTDGGPPGDSRIQSLALEAAWAAKYAGLSEHEALGLVSTNIETILGMERNKSGDIVIWEGNPLKFGTPVLSFQDDGEGGRLEVASCWPTEETD